MADVSFASEKEALWEAVPNERKRDRAKYDDKIAHLVCFRGRVRRSCCVLTACSFRRTRFTTIGSPRRDCVCTARWPCRCLLVVTVALLRRSPSLLWSRHLAS